MTFRNCVYTIFIFYCHIVLSRLVVLKAKVTTKSGNDVCYEYKKPMPENIVPDKSNVEVCTTLFATELSCSFEYSCICNKLFHNVSNAFTLFLVAV